MAEQPAKIGDQEEISDHDYRRTMIAMGRALVVLLIVLIAVGILNLIELKELTDGLGF